MARGTMHELGRAWPWAFLVAVLMLAGCGTRDIPIPEAASSDEGKQTAPAANTTDSKGEQPSDAAAGAGAAGSDADPVHRDRLHQSFADATRQGDDPPPDCMRPPDKTVSDKSVFKIYKQVVQSWDSIRFVNAEGKRIEYTATIETDHGVIEMALLPDLAPNHVRSFVALARAGYYDGLFFERIRHEKPEEDPTQEIMAIEGGCPMGTGDAGSGSIGYWLKPELSSPESSVTHEPGTVGACPATDEPDTAACRFYINLTNAPILNGRFTVFGKVTQGLDVARKIFLEPIIVEQGSDESNGCHRPENPVRIDKVTIHTQVAEAK